MKRKIEIARFLVGIDKLIKLKKYQQAEKYLKEYIRNNTIAYYPVVRKLGHVLRLNGKQEEAIELLLPIINSTEKLKVYYELAYDYADLGQYEESLNYIDLLLQSVKNCNEDFVSKIKVLELYIKSTIGNEEIDGSITNTLLFDYSKEKAIEHIIESHGYNATEKAGHFYENIDITDLYEKIQQEINNREDLIYIKLHLRREYHFHYKSIGRDYNDKQSEILTVITNDDMNIVTMYPNLCNLDVEINYLEFLSTPEFKSKKIRKRKSQIEKFNQKYGKMN